MRANIDVQTFTHLCSFGSTMDSLHRAWMIGFRQSGSIVLLCVERSQSLDGDVAIEGYASVTILENMHPSDSVSAHAFSECRM